MKTLSTIFLALFFTASINILNAQSQASQTKLNAPESWSAEQNWLQAYRSEVSAYGSLSWITESMGDGAELFTSRSEKGIILVQEMENEDELSLLELAEMEYIEGNGTQLLPADPAVVFYGDGATAKLTGTVNGAKVHMQKVCIPATEEGKYLSVMSIVPANAADAASLEGAFESGRMFAGMLLEQNANAITQAE